MSDPLRVLIVEDQPFDADLMVHRLTEEGFRPDWSRVESEADYLAALKDAPELILSDWRLPQFSGLRALDLLRASGLDIPFIIISGSIGEEAAVEALHHGAFDYILKDRPQRLGAAARRALEDRHVRRERRQAEEAERIMGRRYRLIAENSTDVIWTLDRDFRFTYISPSIVKLRGLSPEEAVGETIEATMTPDSYRRIQEDLERKRPDLEAGRAITSRIEVEQLRKDRSTVWVEIVTQAVMDSQGRFNGFVGVSRDITERKGAEKTLQDTLGRLRRVTGSIIEVIAKAVETRDPYTAGHQRRVGDLARAIAGRMGLPPGQIEGIRVAGAIHDLGKISIPAEILSMPRQLNAIEYEMVKIHAQAGADILRDVEFDWPIARIIAQHHERMDGTGYPAKLRGGDTLVEARIIAVADVVEAIASHRPYRPARGLEAALAEIESQRGTQFDAEAVDACLDLFRHQGYRLVDA